MKHLDSSEVVDRLFKGAEELLYARVNLRKQWDMLQDVYEDATAFGPALYADPLVKETRDVIHKLDGDIGTVVRQMEHLARQIKKRDQEEAKKAKRR